MPTKRTSKDFIIMVVDDLNTRYVVRKGKNVSLQSGSETPLALANLVGEQATLLKWNLENAHDGGDAMRVLSKVLDERWRNNPDAKPKLKVLGTRQSL